MCFVGAVQSAIFTVIVEHRPAAWIIGFNVDLVSTVYGVSRSILLSWIRSVSMLFVQVLSVQLQQGVVMSAVVYFVQLWCTEVKGPVFVTMFNPLSTILTAAITYFVLGENLYVGR